MIWETSCLAQNPHPSFRNYDVSDGLPSSEVYQVKQDSRGYIWFATTNGVSRFNGYEFENFSIDDGLPDNTVFNIYEDSKGNVWFLPMSNKLSYYSYADEKIHPYKYNRLIQDSLKKTYLKTSFIVDEKGTVFLGLRFFGLIEISQEGRLKIYSGAKFENKGLFISESANRQLSFFSVNYAKQSDCDSLINLHTRTLSAKINVPANTTGMYPNILAVMLKSREIAVTLDKKLFIFDEKGQYSYYPFEYRPVWIYEDRVGDLWLGTYRGGVYHVRNRDFAHKACYLPGNFVTGVLEDKDGGFWFTTSNKAVFYTPSKATLTYDEQSDLKARNINSLASDGKNLYVSADNILVRRIDTAGHVMSLKFRIFEAENKEVRELFYDTLSSRLILSFPTLTESPVFEDRQNQYLILRAYVQKILPDGTGGYWLATGTGLSALKNGEMGKNYQSSVRFQMVNGLVWESDTSLLMGCPNGLWRFNILNETYHFAGEKDSLLRQRILDLAYIHGKTLCIATKGLGLLLKQGNRIVQISMRDGLSSNNLKSLMVEDSIIWVSSDNGLNRVCIDARGKLKNIRVFSTYDGLASNQISQTVRVGKRIWVASDKGLSFFEPEKLMRSLLPAPVSISKIWINEKPVPVRESYTLNYTENMVRFVYLTLDYKRAGRIRYRYRMEGLDTVWVYTYSREVQYTTLPPGQYRFVVEVESASGGWHAGTFVKLEILAPFWKTWWFVILMGAVLVGGTYILVNYLNRRKQKAADREQENQRLLLSLKLKALRAQMNPHFIFNVMNSIQHFIVLHEEDSAQRYLSKFSRLIRTILNNSDSNTISLAEELQALMLYLELENMRFETQFDYEITVDQLIDTEHVQIPSMLIQPYVENAVKHGMLESKKPGRIRIVITRQGKHLKCSIEDNGVGRSNTAGRHKAGHRSFGTAITKDRLSVLNELHKSSLSEMVTDLYDADGQPAGTRVDIYIPFLSPESR